MTLDEAKNLLQIDRNKLHVECEKQPSIFFQVCEEYAKALDERDALKELLDRTYSELFIDAKQGEFKVSDSLAESKVLADDRYRNVHTAFLNAKKNVELWGAIKDAFIQRGQALRMLVDLFVQQYYGSSFEVTTRDTEKIKNKLIKK